MMPQLIFNCHVLSSIRAMVAYIIHLTVETRYYNGRLRMQSIPKTLNVINTAI